MNGIDRNTSTTALTIAASPSEGQPAWRRIVIHTEAAQTSTTAATAVHPRPSRFTATSQTTISAAKPTAGLTHSDRCSPDSTQMPRPRTTAANTIVIADAYVPTTARESSG
jgi:hypothetical protein